MITISVIIPTYNSAAYISDALESIFAQKFLPAEIIVVDDCSTDNTCVTVEQLKNVSPVELRLIRLPRNSGGPVTPMNTGIEAASGDWIAMLDHDDQMATGRMELASQFAIKDAAMGIVFGQSQEMDSQGIRLKPRPEAYERFGGGEKIFPADIAFQSLISQGFGYGGAGGMLVRKAAWQDVRGFDSQYKICWDYDFALRTTHAGWNVGYIPDVVYYHRRHENNLEHGAGGTRLYEEVSMLLSRLRGDGRLNSAQRRAVDINLARRAITAAQQQRALGNFALAQRFYQDAWKTQAAYLPSLLGMAKNYCSSWIRRG